MAGIVLVTKPSFIFKNETNTLLKGSWIQANATKDWRDQYDKGIFFLFDLKSKCKSKMSSLHIFQFICIVWLMRLYFLTFDNIAPIPPEHDPEDYYFIGALVALSCAIFGGALIVICSKVTLISFQDIYVAK